MFTALASLRMAGLGFDIVRYVARKPGDEIPAPPYPFFLEFLRGWESSPMKQVAFLAAGVALSELIRAGLNSTYLRCAGHLVHERIVVDLRARVYDKLQRLSFGFFDGNATGSIINRVTSDVPLRPRIGASARRRREATDDVPPRPRSGTSARRQ